MKKNENSKETSRQPMGRKTKRAMAVYAALVLMMTAGATTVYAAGDPLTVINNLSDFIFGLIRAVGLILLGWGIVQVGLSLQSHDPSQRSNGFLTLAGGGLDFRLKIKVRFLCDSLISLSLWRGTVRRTRETWPKAEGVKVGA